MDSANRLSQKRWFISFHPAVIVPGISGIFKVESAKYNRNHKGVLLVISYRPLWETMRRKNVTTYTLINKYQFSKGTLDSLKQGRNISTATLDDICRILGYKVEDVLVYIPNETQT
jgi:DNA-binding Xre family transcriptional regulator